MKSTELNYFYSKTAGFMPGLLLKALQTNRQTNKKQISSRAEVTRRNVELLEMQTTKTRNVKIIKEAGICAHRLLGERCKCV